MRLGKWLGTWCAVAALAASMGACNGQTSGGDPKFGSETNWLGDCSRTGECTEGTCVCGICTASCTTDDTCGSDGSAVCASTGGALYQVTCGDVADAPEAVCVGTCRTAADCETSMDCIGGACVAPSASPKANGFSSEGPVSGVQSFFVDTLQTAEPGATLSGRCLPRQLPVSDGAAACVLVEAFSTSSCTCDTPGRHPAGSGAALAALEQLELAGRCGGQSNTPCQDLCLCEIAQETGSALESCRNDPDSSSFDGWCYVAPEQGYGNPDLVSECPSTERQLVRLGDRSGERSIVIACGASSLSGPVDLPAALGEPCITTDEYRPEYGSHAATEVTIETDSPFCDSGLCVAHHFQGRVSCPYGQESLDSDPHCSTPTGEPVAVPVRPQLYDRPSEDAVICSCRCDGPEGTGPFCDCPTGMECAELVSDIGVGSAELAGSYCVNEGTHVDDPAALANGPECQLLPGSDTSPGNCGPTDGGW